MKQYNIYGNIENYTEKHPQFEDKIVEPAKYYGSELNKFVAAKCRKDIVVINIDLIINDYKNNSIRIIESKHSKEKLGKGQKLLLERLSKKGINTYCIYGNQPYDNAKIYSFQTKTHKNVNKKELIDFLNNK